MPLSLTLALLRLFMVFKCSSYLKCRFSTGDVKSSMTASNSHNTALRSSSSSRNAGKRNARDLLQTCRNRISDKVSPQCNKHAGFHWTSLTKLHEVLLNLWLTFVLWLYLWRLHLLYSYSVLNSQISDIRQISCWNTLPLCCLSSSARTVSSVGLF